MSNKLEITENWGYPNTVWFGNGRIKDLPKACKVLNIKNPLFVTDKDLAKTKMVEETLEINKRAKLPTFTFFDLKGNPLGSHVKKGVEVFKNGNHDGVIAFGGGSSLDVGKSIVYKLRLIDHFGISQMEDLFGKKIISVNLWLKIKLVILII